MLQRANVYTPACLSTDIGGLGGSLRGLVLMQGPPAVP